MPAELQQIWSTNSFFSKMGWSSLWIDLLIMSYNFNCLKSSVFKPPWKGTSRTTWSIWACMTQIICTGHDSNCNCQPILRLCIKYWTKQAILIGTYFFKHLSLHTRTYKFLILIKVTKKTPLMWCVPSDSSSSPFQLKVYVQQIIVHTWSCLSFEIK